MPNIVSSHYSHELSDWEHAMEFYNQEIEGLTRQLGEVISRNSIVGIAARVETEQEILDKTLEQFNDIRVRINQQQDTLYTDDTLIDDVGVTGEIQEKQDGLRHLIREAEKNYVDVKFNCYRFLSDTLKK